MNFETFVTRILDALNKSKVKYVIVGGIAAVFYGRPRTTMDVDLIVMFEKNEIDILCRILKKEGFEVDKKEIKNALEEKSHASFFIKNCPYRIDLKGIYSKLDVASFENRKRVKIFGRNALIESPEDLIVAKLVYGAAQDIEDVKAILLRARKLDKNYLRKRTEEEKVSEKLKELI
jgi:hypothetical protein